MQKLLAWARLDKIELQKKTTRRLLAAFSLRPVAGNG
jgi:hypothetical protein